MTNHNVHWKEAIQICLFRACTKCVTNNWNEHKTLRGQRKHIMYPSTRFNDIHIIDWIELFRLQSWSLSLTDWNQLILLIDSCGIFFLLLFIVCMTSTEHNWINCDFWYAFGLRMIYFFVSLSLLVFFVVVSSGEWFVRANHAYLTPSFIYVKCIPWSACQIISSPRLWFTIGFYPSPGHRKSWMCLRGQFVFA